MSSPVLVIGNKNYSSWSLRGWLALRKSGASFREQRLALDTPAFDAVIGELSPTRQVPVLILGSHRIWDSLAIGEYANERWANGTLLPGDPDLRGQARSLCAEMHAGFAALRADMPMNIRATDRRVPMSRPLTRDIERILSIWTAQRSAHAATGPWLFGDFTLVDAMYAPVVFRFLTYGVDVPAAARGYMDTVTTDPDSRAWCAAALEEEEVVEADEAGL